MPVTEQDAVNAFRATQLFADDPEKVKKAEAIRDAYVSQRRQSTRQLFQDRQTYGLDPEAKAQLDEAFFGQPEARFELFNERFFTSELGVNKEQARELRPELMAEYSKKAWGEVITDDKAFYERQGVQYDFEDSRDNLAAEAVRAGRSMQDALAEFDFEYVENPAYKGKEAERKAEFKARYQEANARIRPMNPQINAFTEELKRSMGVGEGDGEAMPDEWFLNMLMKQPKEDRGIFLSAVAARAGEGEAKTLFQAMSERIGRQSADMFRGAKRGAHLSSLAQLEKMIVANGVPKGGIPEEYGFDAAALYVAETGLDIAGGFRTAYADVPKRGSEEWDALPEETRGALDRLQEEKDFALLYSQVNDIATGAIDPAESSNLYGKGMLGLSSMAPTMTLMAAGPVGSMANIASYQGLHLDDMLQRNPDMDLGEAQGVSSIIGIGQGLSDLIPFHILQGKTPFLNKWLKQASLTKGSLGRRVAARTVGGSVLEFGQEFGQDVIIPQAVEDLAIAIGKDFEGVDLSERLAGFTSSESLSELIPTIVALSLIGAGAGSISDYKGGKALVGNYELLLASGVNEKDASEIRRLVREDDLQGAQDKLRAAFKDTENAKKGTSEIAQKAAFKLVEQRIKMTETMADAIELNLLPEMQLKGGKYRLQFKDGSGLVEFDTFEEARDTQWQIAEDANIDLHVSARSVINHFNQNLEEGRGLDYVLSAERPTTVQAVEQGITTEEAALNREAISRQQEPEEQAAPQEQETEPAEGDIDTEYSQAVTASEIANDPANDSALTQIILGSNVTAFAGGVETTTIKLFRDATPFTIIEEKTEGDADVMLKDGHRDRLIAMIRQWENVSDGEVLFLKGKTDDELTRGDIKEAWSDLTLAYFVDQNEADAKGGVFNSKKFQSEIQKALDGDLSGALTAYAHLIKAYFKRASVISKMRREGKLDAELESELARSVGLGEQQQFNRSVQEEGAKIRDEIELPDDDAPFSVIEKGPEVSVIDNFMAQFDDPADAIKRGEIGPEPGASRDESFAEEFNNQDFREQEESSLPSSPWARNQEWFVDSGFRESAKDAIKNGQGLGYSPEDIARYLAQNYGGHRWTLQENGEPIAESETSFSTITIPSDADYMAAVESGDMDATQSMVDDAAKAAGIPLRLYHGTTETDHREPNRPGDRKGGPMVEFINFEVFETNEMGVHLGNGGAAEMFGEPFAFFVNIKNPLRLPDLGTWNYQNVIREARFAGVEISEAEYDAVFNAFDNERATADLLKEKGYDGIIYNNEVEGYGDSWIAFDPNQIKSADPVTYDSSGNVIPLSKRFDSGRDEISFSVITSKFLRDDPRFETLKADGRIETSVDVEGFTGSHILMHSPDMAFSGDLSFGDETIAEGKGGAYYPLLFADDNYFWASTEGTAKNTAKHLNTISRKNGGRTLMALLSAPVEKLFSSTTMATGTIDFFNKLADTPRLSGVNKAKLNSILVKASKVTSPKGSTFGLKLLAKDGLENNLSTLKKALQPTNSTFDLRKVFVESVASQVAENTTNEKHGKYIAELLLADDNRFAKAHIRKGKLSKASIMQALGHHLSEPFLRDFQEFKNGAVYSIIEVEGEVEAVRSGKHESYPFAIVPKNREAKVKVSVLDKAYDWQDIVGRETGEYSTPQERTNLMPTGGMSVTSLKVLGPREAASPVREDVSFSTITNPDERIAAMFSPFQRSPELRISLAAEMKRRGVEVSRKFAPVFAANRTKKDIEAERKDKEAELIGDKLDTLSPATVGALEASDSLVDESIRPILSRLSTRKTYTRKDGKVIGYWGGSIKAKSKASKNTINEYNDMPEGLPSREVFGGEMSPDQAAQAAGFDDVTEFWEALGKEVEGFQERSKETKAAEQAIKDLEKEARDESREWAAEQQKLSDTVGSDRATLLAALRTLEAIKSALPEKVRGKIGGAVPLAKLKGPQAMLDEIERQVERIDKVLEKYLVKELRERIEKQFKRAEVKKTTKGVPKKPTLPAEITDEIIRIKKISELSKAEFDEQVAALNEKVAANEDPQAEEAILDELIQLIGFGHIDGMKSEQLADFKDNLTSLIDKGRLIKQVLDEEHKAEVDRVVDIVNNDVTGGKGPMTSSQAKRRANKTKGLISGLTGVHRRNVSFEWLMNGLVRENLEVGTLDSETHKELSTLVHNATHAEKRANQKSEKEFRDFLTEIFVVKGIRLDKKMTDLSEEIEKTNVHRIDYGVAGRTTKKQVRVSNVRSVLDGTATAESLGFDKAEWGKIKESYEALLAKGKELKGNRIVRYEVENKGKEEELILSQDQVINLTMLFRQEELKVSMIEEGYSEETMKQMEKFLSPESKAIRDWLTDFYDRNYDELNAVFKVENGVSLPKIEFYSPAVRKAQGVEKEMQVNSQGGSAMTTTPSFFISRVSNFARMDQTVGAINLYASHAAQTNHYIAWAKPIKKLRGVFGNAQVKDNIQSYRGNDILSLINERIEWIADGGNRKAGHIRFLDSLRSTFTMASLSYNWAVMVKQLTSLPAYAYDMPLADFVKYSGKFMANVPKHAKEMLATDYVKARLTEGYERDVIESLRGHGGYVKSGLQTGMLFGKAGDIVPIITGGWMAKQRAYDVAIKDGATVEQAEAQSIIAFEMSSDRAQQAGDLKDLSHFQGSGSIAKLFTMFKTSPRQYYANVYESLLDAKAGKKGAGSEFARRFFIGQIVLPLTFQFVSDLIRSGFNDEGEEDYNGADYMRAAIMGPLNGLFIFGDFAELLTAGISDTRIWFEELPIFDGPTKVAGAMQEFWDGDLLEGTDELLRGMGKMVHHFTYYEIIRREIDRIGLLDE